MNLIQHGDFCIWHGHETHCTRSRDERRTTCSPTCSPPFHWLFLTALQMIDGTGHVFISFLASSDQFHCYRFPGLIELHFILSFLIIPHHESSTIQFHSPGKLRYIATWSSKPKKVTLQGLYILIWLPASIKPQPVSHVILLNDNEAHIVKNPWLEAGIDSYRQYVQAQIFILDPPSQGCCTHRISVDGVEDGCCPLNLPRLRAYWDSTLFGSRQQQLLACQTSSRQYCQYRQQQQQYAAPRSLFIYFPAVTRIYIPSCHSTRQYQSWR